MDSTPKGLRRIRPGKAIQHLQTAHWLWYLGVPGLVASFVGGLSRLWFEFGVLWQVLTAVAAYVVSLGIADVAIGRIRAHRRGSASNAELAAQLDSLAQNMTAVLADAQRSAPVHRMGVAIGDERAMDQEWARGNEDRQRHESQTIGRFKERFFVEWMGYLAELRQRELITEEMMRHEIWTLNSVHHMDNIPANLVKWARELRRR